MRASLLCLTQPSLCAPQIRSQEAYQNPSLFGLNWGNYLTLAQAPQSTSPTDFNKGMSPRYCFSHPSALYLSSPHGSLRHVVYFEGSVTNFSISICLVVFCRNIKNDIKLVHFLASLYSTR